MADRVASSRNGRLSDPSHSRMWSFLTLTSDGEPRTEGVIVAGAFIDRTAAAKAAAEWCVPSGTATATGKVAVVDERERAVEVFQRMPDRSVHRAWCGNATLAAMAATATTSAVVIGPTLRRVNADLTTEVGGCAGLQLTVDGTPHAPFSVDSYVILSNFNDYVLTVGLRMGEVPATSGNTKVLNLSLTGSIPEVEVHLAGGMHGALPFTGGAELSLARNYLPWLDEALVSGTVSTPRGVERLPQVELMTDRYTVRFSPRRVSLCTMDDLAS